MPQQRIPKRSWSPQPTRSAFGLPLWRPWRFRSKPTQPWQFLDLPPEPGLELSTHLQARHRADAVDSQRSRDRPRLQALDPIRLQGSRFSRTDLNPPTFAPSFWVANLHNSFQAEGSLQSPPRRVRHHERVPRVEPTLVMGTQWSTRLV